jgi:hypothetical protein
MASLARGPARVRGGRPSGVVADRLRPRPYRGRLPVDRGHWLDFP